MPILESEMVYARHRRDCWACAAVDTHSVPGAKRCPEGQQKVKLAETERRANWERSEFGVILGISNGGDIIASEGSPKREDGTIIYVSSAFNPLTSDQLREIADAMDRWKSN